MKGITFPDQDVEQVVLSRDFFKMESVFAAASKFTNKYHVMIQPYGDDKCEITIRPKEDNHSTYSPIKMFCNELIEEQVRNDLQNRFGKLREIIVAQAFSPLEDK